MKFHFFIKDIPMMLLVGFLVVFVASRYDEPAKLLSYQSTYDILDSYHGETIEDESVKGQSIGGQTPFGKPKDVYADMTPLSDNGCTYAIRVNKTQNVVTIYTLDQEGLYTVPYKAMVCSVGKSGNTPEGIYPLGDRTAWLALEGGVYGQYCTGIIGDFLFHSVPYFSQNKNDLEIEEYNKLGQSVSAGCVRLSVIDAKWIFDHCMEGTYVEIYESEYPGPMGKPVSAILSSGGSRGNWDPTDPDPDNPYIGVKPVIFGAYDREVQRYGDVDILCGVSALDSSGQDITEDIKVQGEIDTTVCGTYAVTYKVEDENGLTGSATANIRVTDSEPPVIVVNQEVNSLCMYDVSDEDKLRSMLLQNVTAYDSGYEMDKESILMDYSDILEKGCGDCEVKYCAVDSEGNRSNVVIVKMKVDIQPPKLELIDENPGIIHLSNVLDDEYMMGLIRVTDNSEDVKVTISRPLKHLNNEPYVVMFCAQDEFGNVSTLSVSFQIN